MLKKVIGTKGVFLLAGLIMVMVGTVILSISPENNENGFVIRSKTTEFIK